MTSTCPSLVTLHLSPNHSDSSLYGNCCCLCSQWAFGRETILRPHKYPTSLHSFLTFIMHWQIFPKPLSTVMVADEWFPILPSHPHLAVDILQFGKSLPPPTKLFICRVYVCFFHLAIYSGNHFIAVHSSVQKYNNPFYVHTVFFSNRFLFGHFDRFRYFVITDNVLMNNHTHIYFYIIGVVSSK